MSDGYASRLKDFPNKGVCGLPETIDSERSSKIKIRKLASLIQQSKHTVVLTGAGISTAAGVPDFRGPNGIWTQEQKKNKKQKTNSGKATVSIQFDQAKPTFTHRAITQLVQDSHVQFCITQNVDGLHRRSGLSRDHHSVLHGCVFTETCENPQCRSEHFRDVDVGGMSFKKTGRQCDACQSDLRDTLLDWNDLLPEDDLERSNEHCEKADLAICLGTSLRIEPAGSLPTKAKQFVIVNLQATPYDKEANCALLIRQRTDIVLRGVLEHLGYNIGDDGEVNVGAKPIERFWKPNQQEKALQK